MFINNYFPSDIFVEINGGEPLLKQDLVYKMADSLHNKFKLTLNTNGSLLDQQVINNLKKSGIDTIKLSLYSLNSDVNDLLRGQAGSYDSAMTAIGLINSAGLNLELAVLITSKNIGQIPQLLDYASRLPKTVVIFQPLDEKIESPESKNFIVDNLPRDLWPTDQQTKAFFAYLNKDNYRGLIKNSVSQLELIKDYYLSADGHLNARCFVGQRLLMIDADGSCCLCFKGNTIGNIVDSEIKNILSGSAAKEERMKDDDPDQDYAVQR